MIIGVSGQRGSFSEEAAQYYCHKNKINDFRIVYLVSVENVLKALVNGEAEIGIFPIENSNGGVVEEAIYAMSQYNFKIQQLFEIDVKHNLIVKPGAKAEEIKKIVSHQQALRQCRMYLKRIWPSVEVEEYADTAQAAADLAHGVLSASTAVIASRNAAEIYGLDILDEGVQDLKFNFTNFIVAAKE